ncbi:MAG: acetate--CoA ligase family protein [Actinomycetota bacterium]|nr:acetate--CoA ligase family protein [Actinomycetota bacterium]
MNGTGVAIVGARPGSLWTNLLTANIGGWGYPGAIWPVSRTRQEVVGIPAFPSLDELPDRPDAVVLATGTRETIELARTSVAMGIEHIVTIADGFAERGTAEGQALQEELASVVAGTSIRLYGPNGLGFADFRSGLCPLSVPLPLDLAVGNVSIISQSGSLLSSITGGLICDGVGADWGVSIGNGAAFHVTDALEYLVTRETTTIICGYVESFGPASRERVEAALTAARDAGKRIVLLKAGSSERSARIALSHTASVAGTDRVMDELLRAHGVIRVHDAEELVRTVTVLDHLQSYQAKAGGLGVLEGSGGTAAVVSDNLQAGGARLAEFSAETLTLLRDTAPAGAYVENPVDLTAAPKPPGAIDQAYEQVYRDPDVAVVLVPWSLTFPAGDDGRELHEVTLDRYCALTRLTGTPTLLCTANLQRWTPWMREYQRKHPEMLVVLGLHSTIAALAHLYPAGSGPAAEAAPASSAATSAAAGPAGVLVGEAEGREILGRLDVPIVGGTLWTPAFEAPPDVSYPCVVKAVVPGLAHRARLGAVVVGCRDAAEVIAARDIILANLAQAGFPAEVVEGLLIEEMAFGPELLVGFSRDAWYGSYVALARGGVNVEEQRPVLLDLPPERAEAALAGLGLYGLSPATATATAQLIGQLATEFTGGSLADYATVELNPVILTDAGPRVADVLLVRK